MTQYEYLSAGTDVVFPYTSIQAISSDNLAIGGGDPNELLVSLLNRVFTRITSLESLVATLTTQVNTLRNQLASLQVPEITEHFTLYLYTYTADTDTYPTDAAGEDNVALFDSEGEVNEEDTLNSNGWFTSAEKAASAGRESGYATPGIWGIKLEVSKRDGGYFIYPSIEDFKYDPQLTNGEALIATFLQKIEDVKTDLEAKIDAVDDKADNAQSTINGAVTAATNAVDSSINIAVNNILTTKGVTTDNITKWNNFNSLKESLEAEFRDGFVSKLGTALTLRGFSEGDHDKLIAVHTKLSGITNLDTYIDDRVALGNGISAETILNKLANNTDNLTFTDGGVSKTRTAKARLSELLFGADTNDNVITADTYMLKTGLVKFKEAMAIDNIQDTSNTEYNSFRNIVKQMVGLDSGNLVDVVANSSGSGGGVNMEALELAVMSDQDNAFKRALNKWKVSGLGMSATTDTMDTWKTANITLSFVRDKMGLTTGMIKAAAEWNPDPNSGEQCSESAYNLYNLTPIDPCTGLIGSNG